MNLLHISPVGSANFTPWTTGQLFTTKIAVNGACLLRRRSRLRRVFHLHQSKTRTSGLLAVLLNRRTQGRCALRRAIIQRRHVFFDRSTRVSKLRVQHRAQKIGGKKPGGPVMFSYLCAKEGNGVC